MSNSANSQNHFSGDSDHFYDPNFTAEISQKMRVPKRINVDGVCDLPNVNRPEAHWMPAEKLDMHVPEKIIVAGEDGHFSTRAIPREISLDNTIMPPDPGIVRVQTPPRVITIDSNYYQDEYHQPSPSYKETNIRRFGEMDRRVEHSSNNNTLSLNDSTVVPEGMSINDEVVHLRRQLAKLNRRVMSIELDNLQRQNRDKVVYALGLAYFFFKTVLWLSRSS